MVVDHSWGHALGSAEPGSATNIEEGVKRFCCGKDERPFANTGTSSIASQGAPLPPSSALPLSSFAPLLSLLASAVTRLFPSQPRSAFSCASPHLS